MTPHRRAFLQDVGTGVLTAAVGPALVADLGLGTALADEARPARLEFGPLEPLVALLQETPAARLLPALVERLNKGTSIDQLVAAAALSNARTFGGEDYVGFHTLMALTPSLLMSRALPAERRALPVLKVLYRNTNRIGEFGGVAREVLHPVRPAAGAARPTFENLREAVHSKEVNRAETTFAAVAAGTPEEALNALLPTVEEQPEVHRIVLAYRAWDLLPVVGRAHAHTLLRQSVRYCVRSERYRRPDWDQPAKMLVKLLEGHRLLSRPAGNKAASDDRLDRLVRDIFSSAPATAAEAAAAALAEGLSPAAVGEAISLAANQLVLRDAGRPKAQISAGKPIGSVHGDSIGVHASDSANAWRNLARVANPRNQAACLILGAWQVARDRGQRGGEFLTWTPYPRPDAIERLKAKEPAGLLREAETAIRAKDQALAAAAVHRLGQLGHPHGPVFDLLLRYAISEDGALHAEKYYSTVATDFATTRPSLRWRHLIGLARVTASAYGQAAPGYADACRLLKV